MKAKYVNPFTDFGFKKLLFGEEASKDLLADFLNQLLPPEHQIKKLQFKNTEQMGALTVDRRAVYDIYCEAANDSKFIVELQKAKQNFFKDRTIFYSTFPIRDQAEQGDWNFELKLVYCVGILDFVFEEDANNPDYLHTVKLKNQHHQVFYEKLVFVYIEMPKFNKTAKQLKTRFDKWLYFIKHLEDFQSIPRMLNDKVFKKGFQRAEIANYSRKVLDSYEQSLKIYRDLKKVVDTAFDEGRVEGRAEGRAEGLQEGKQAAIIERIRRDLQRGKLTIAEIAEDAEVSVAAGRQLAKPSSGRKKRKA